MTKTNVKDMIAELISAVECANLPQFDDLLAEAQAKPTDNVEQAVVSLLAVGFGLGLYGEEGVW